MKITEIEKLLPHKPPMLFISDIKEYSFEENKLIAEININESDIMFQNNIDGIPAYSALEYMAQAIGCFVGLYDKKNNPDAVPGVGFVIGTRKLKINQSILPKNSTYFVEVKPIFFDETIASFECKMFSQEKIIAEAIINAFRPTDIQSFMKENA